MALFRLLRLLGLAYKLRRGWALMSASQRRRIARGAAGTGRRHGPTIVRGVRKAVKQARKAR